MLEKGREYPAAITLPISSDPGALGHAVTWIAGQDRELGGVPLLYAPAKRNLEYDPGVSPCGEGHGGRDVAHTWQPAVGRRGGPRALARP